MLSINVRQASLTSADAGWEPAFTELSLADLVMRKLLSVSDLTICLDKRGAMGKIESYEVKAFFIKEILKRCFYCKNFIDVMSLCWHVNSENLKEFKVQI